MRPVTRRVAMFLLGSGFAALVYQTAWERMLRLVFGASTAASSAVLAIFLGGLGAGGYVLGKRAERHPRPLVFYGNLEMGVALSAAITPFLVELVARSYWAIGGSGALGIGGATLVRLLGSALVLGPSVVLMGGTLPAAARSVEEDEDVARGELALLYASNTLGAVLGALFGTFVLFELFGIRLSLWTAALVNVLVALLARRFGQSRPEVPVTAVSEDAPESTEIGTNGRAVLSAAFVVGFVFLGLEIVWYRMLSPLLGGSSFSFGLVLAVALAGIGLGGYLYSRRKEDSPATLSLLALTVAVEAACVLTPIGLGDGVAYFAAYTRPAASLGFSTLVLSWAAIASLVVLPASIVAGYQFPVLFALLGRGRREVARQVGLAYAANTAGSILGALLAGFVLLPRLGAVGLWKLLAGVLIAFALGLVALELRAERRALGRVMPSLVAAGVALVLLAQRGPTAVSRHTPIGAGRVSIASLDRNALRAWSRRMDLHLVWEKDGVDSSFGVAYGNGLTFLVSGKADGAVFGDRGTQALCGLIPALLHEDPKQAFVLGLGTGMSAGWLAAVPGVERVDVAELEPGIVEVARASSAANADILARRNVELFLGDGREFLLTHDRKYDIVVSEPSNPYRAGVAALFTQDFYRVVEKRLRPGGIFAQWVQGYEIDTDTLRIVLATLTSVFPFVEAWQTQGGDFLLLASAAPRVYDVARLRSRLAVEPYRTIWPRAGLVADAEGVLSHFIAGDALVRAIGKVSGTPVNTDDANLLEYAFARRVGASGVDISVELSSLTIARNLARPDVSGAVDWRRVDELRDRAWVITGGIGPELPLADADVRRRAKGFAAVCTGDIVAGARAWYAQKDLAPKDPAERFIVAQMLAQERDERALTLATELGTDGYRAEEQVIRARYLAGKGQREAALEALLLAVQELRSSALPLCNAAHEAIGLLVPVTRGRPDLAARGARGLLAGPLAALNQEEHRVNTAQRLAFQSGDSALCVEALGRNLERPWWELPFLAARAECLERAGHPLAARARADVGEWVSASLGSIEAGLALPPPAYSVARPEETRDGGVEPPQALDAGALAATRDAAAEDAGADSDAGTTADAADAGP